MLLETMAAVPVGFTYISQVSSRLKFGSRPSAGNQSGNVVRVIRLVRDVAKSICVELSNDHGRPWSHVSHIRFIILVERRE